MRNLNRTESDALRGIALLHGYTATRGPKVKDGQESGNPIELLLAIVSGEVATVLLADEERSLLINWLDAQVALHQEQKNTQLASAIESLSAQLRAATEREECHEP